MAEVSVQDVGGTLMVEVPAIVQEQLRLRAGTRVELDVDGQSLTIRRSKYRLEDLLADSDPDAFVQTEEDREWHRSGPVGRELL
jgi:antitoxin component of MazEF toxin-antitoxin module